MKPVFNIMTLAFLLGCLVVFSCKKERLYNGYQPQPAPGDTTVIKKAPVASAGPDQTVTLPADSTLLDGAFSNDSDGNIVAGQWTKISGPLSFNIANPNNITTRVKNLVQGIYLFELTVTDNDGLFAKDTVQVTVAPFFNPGGNDIYIAGWGKNANGRTVARIFKNNVIQDLSDGLQDAGAYAVTVSANDVYVAGFDGDKAILWKNGVPLILGNGVARSVFVSGTDVYVAGKTGTAATFWKNGVANSLGDGEVKSVFVSGNDVYLTGNSGTGIAATLWKNGVPQILSYPYEYYYNPSSVFVSGNDVYVAGTLDVGYYGTGAILWKNGVEELIGRADGMARSVFVYGSDVYVAGWTAGNWTNYVAGATIYKNGVPINLTNGQINTIANAVFVYGSVVYATGGKLTNADNVSYLWINGSEQVITGFSQANSVFVN